MLSLAVAVLSSLVYVERRKVLQVFPDPVRQIWNDWELRVMVLLSLFLQMSLIYYGSRRKYNVRTWIRVFLWFAYLVADLVAMVSLGVLSNDAGKGNKLGVLSNDAHKCRCDHHEEKPMSALAAFWAPFLLLHLGGPDTITAYALEDNELWMRHLLGLVFQSGVTLYVFLMAWNGSWISNLSIPVFVSGFIKYVERTLVLRSASREVFRDSMLTSPDPGPNYEKFMEELCIRRDEGYYVVVKLKKEDANDYNCDSEQTVMDMVTAHCLFQSFKRLFVDLILSFRDRDESQKYIQNLTPDDAFKVVEIELGFAYDVFYTKAPFIYTRWGCISRVLTVSSMVVTLVLFLIFERPKKDHEPADLVISYVLMGGAIGLEIYAAVLIVSSDWTSLSLADNPKQSTLFQKIMSPLHPEDRIKQRTRWSNSMAQFNLLSYCLKRGQNCKYFIPFGLMRRVFDHMKQLEMLRYQTHEPITPELRELVFYHFKDKSKKKVGLARLRELVFYHFMEKSKKKVGLARLCNNRGGDHLVDRGRCSISISEWTTEIEFDQSILIWHIATDMLLHTSNDHDDGEEENLDTRKVSKSISNYMLYLLVTCPYMLPFGIGLIRFRDTLAEAAQFLKERSPVKGEIEACKLLGEVNTSVPPKQVKGDRSKSVLFDACRLALELEKMETKEKWKLVSEVWVEMLGYAACHCRGNFHAQQLRRGGELLTHVWLLMAHLGITEMIQISEGHARPMLSAK